MKTKIVGICILAIAGMLTQNTHAQAPDAGFSVTGGALMVRPFDGMTFDHPNMAPPVPHLRQPAISGTTGLEHQTLTDGTIGLNYQAPSLWDLITLDIEGGAVFGPRYRQQMRGYAPRPPHGYCGPAPIGPMLYTELPGYGWYASSSLLCYVGPVYAGIQGQLTGLALESGSDNHVERHGWWIDQSFGPKAGLRLGDHVRLEGSYQFGNRGNLTIAKFIWKF